MTEINIERVNQITSGFVASTLGQFEDGVLDDEEFIAELYGKLVVAHALGWDVSSMAEEARQAGTRLIEAVEAAAQETEQE